MTRTARLIRTHVTLAVLVFGLMPYVALHADVRIRLATLAPEHSVFMKTLREMGDAWRTRTDGRITSIVLPGFDDEDEMLQEMRMSKRLQGAQLTGIALSRLDDAFGVFGIPMFFDSYEEVDFVLAKLGPTLEGRLEAKGLKLLHWGHAGWVHIFSISPVRSVDDLKKLKIFTSAGDTRLTRWYNSNGFTPAPGAIRDVLPSLATRMIEAVPVTPLNFQMLTWASGAPYMLDIGFAPLIGATVMTSDAWQKLGPDDQRIVLEEARKAGERLRASVPKLDQDALAQMTGSRKITVTSGNRAEWQAMSEKLATAMRGSLVPADVYDIARRERDAFRESTRTAR
jgi:TRAP-type C4-dicarboxylate transport system substrate-binding protein